MTIGLELRISVGGQRNLPQLGQSVVNAQLYAKPYLLAWTMSKCLTYINVFYNAINFAVLGIGNIMCCYGSLTTVFI